MNMEADHSFSKLVITAGANPADKRIHAPNFGHYGVSFATVSFAHEYSHMPEYGAKLAAEKAERIVACWNACEGISTENLVSNRPVKWLADSYNKKTKQCDALLAALTFQNAYDNNEEWAIEQIQEAFNQQDEVKTEQDFARRYLDQLQRTAIAKAKA